MKKILIIIFLCGAISSFAQTDTLTAEQAKTYINKEVIVKGTIAGTRLFEKEGKKTFLINLDKRYPQTPLTVALFDEAYKELNLKQEIEDKNLIVKGTVTIFNDRPQIVVKDVKNIKILN
jgi:hypothetical protein